MKTSLGIWAFGNMATRFNPAGYKPELSGRSTVEKVRTAVEGLGDLIDDYEFHYPQELSPDNLDEVRDALAGHGIYCIASGLHLDPRFGKGGLAHRTTRRARGAAPDAGGDRPGGRRRCADDHLAGDRGLQLPVPDAVPGVVGAVHRRVGQAAQPARDRGVTIFLEHKNSEPAMKILMRNIGMTLHVIHTLRAQGLDNVTVNMDWQHLIMNGETLGEYAALLAAEGLLGHQHANSGWGTFDDDNMVGTIRVHGDARARGRAPPRALRRERRAARLRPLPVHRGRRRGGRGAACSNGGSSTDVAGRIDDAALREAQRNKDAVAAYELVYAALVMGDLPAVDRPTSPLGADLWLRAKSRDRPEQAASGAAGLWLRATSSGRSRQVPRWRWRLRPRSSGSTWRRQGARALRLRVRSSRARIAGTRSRRRDPAGRSRTPRTGGAPPNARRRRLGPRRRGGGSLGPDARPRRRSTRGPA